jgi:pimeloyl-ACP methyl ester carboxylesterase
MMRRLEAAFGEAGYAVANLGYPSLRAPLEEHAALVRSVAAGLAADGARSIHAVGHSLGGLVARVAMSGPPPEEARWGRLVTMGTPHRGAALADALSDLALYRAVSGGCGQSVTTRLAAGIPVPPGIEIGAIAGGTGGGRGMNPLLGGDNDMIVRVDEARPPAGEADFLLLPLVSHSFMPSRGDAVAAALSFIATGRLGPVPRQ